MKLVRYGTKGADVSAGVVVDDHVVALGALDGAPTDVTALLGAGPDVTADVARKATSARQRTPLSEVVLHAPIPAPSKYLAIGFNFTSHLAEIQEAATQPQYAAQMERFSHLRAAFPDQKLPTFFNKQVSCITGPFDPILAPYDSAMLDYEGELVAVIGKRVRRADAATALGSVAGYTVGNDVSVRDWQQDTPTMWPGKSFDTHGPIGPWVVTADDVDPAGLSIRTWVDGELRQDGSTKE
ncbi:MAG TPA: fumarylacetoacetate hydrolase family protein, partial [Mycobacterium sp.]|nr:fumarylacetoacetate hydrolase family protein [Mycobacterium sp.]